MFSACPRKQPFRYALGMSVPCQGKTFRSGPSRSGPSPAILLALVVAATTNSPQRVLTLIKETTMSESNSVIIRKAYKDFAQGNIPSVFAAFDAGITWHVPGHSPLSGDYTGHDQ